MKNFGLFFFLLLLLNKEASCLKASILTHVLHNNYADLLCSSQK